MVTIRKKLVVIIPNDIKIHKKIVLRNNSISYVKFKNKIKLKKKQQKKPKPKTKKRNNSIENSKQRV